MSIYAHRLLPAGVAPRFLGTPSNPGWVGVGRGPVPLLQKQALPLPTGQGWGLCDGCRSCPRAGLLPESSGHRGALPRAALWVHGNWDCVFGLGEAQPDRAAGCFCPGARSPSLPGWSSPHSAPDRLRGNTLLDVGCGPTIYQFLSGCEQRTSPWTMQTRTARSWRSG